MGSTLSGLSHSVVCSDEWPCQCHNLSEICRSIMIIIGRVRHRERVGGAETEDGGKERW